MNMKTLIFAGGLGTGMRGLTKDKPKCMIPILGKPLLEHILDIYGKFMNDAIILTGYRSEVIERYFGNRFRNVPLTYLRTAPTGDFIDILDAVPKNQIFFTIDSSMVVALEDLQTILSIGPNGTVLGSSKSSNVVHSWGVMHPEFIRRGKDYRHLAEAIRKLHTDLNIQLYPIDYRKLKKPEDIPPLEEFIYGLYQSRGKSK